MTRKELLQIPGLGDLLKSLEDSPRPKGALEPPSKCPPNLAAPGEIWRVVENDQQTEDQDYSRTNPHCSTVIILRRQEEPAGEHTLFRAAPILADIRYCGVEDAIFPREVFGYEAAVACGCEFTLTSKELDRCEGVLPNEWFDRLADFAAWMEAEDDETAPAFPPLLKTGRPFTHPEDPGYIFHANLATNLQPLLATVLEELPQPINQTASEWWRAFAFLIPQFKPTPAMFAHGPQPGAAPPFWHLAVGDTGATVVLDQCTSSAGAFALEVIKDPDNRIEGAEVLDVAGHAVATIAGGKSAVPFAHEGNFLLLRLSDGTIPPLNEIPVS